MASSLFHVKDCSIAGVTLKGISTVRIQETGNPMAVYDGAVGGARSGTVIADPHYQISIESKDLSAKPTLGANGALAANLGTGTTGLMNGTSTLAVTNCTVTDVSYGTDKEGNSTVTISAIAPMVVV